MPEKYRKWLEEEVIYIISETEKDVFKSLTNDEQRENFIKSFWKRRDATPETPFNEYREEHYRRIENANANFFEGRSGWRTDRGRVYIMFGPPDFKETNPGGSMGFLFDNAETSEFPAEVWRYREIPGLKTRISQIEFIFVNYYNAGSYQLTTNPALANALRNVSLPARYAGYEDYLSRNDLYASSEAAAQERLDKQLVMNPLEQLSLVAELTKSRGDVLEELERSARLRKIKGIVDARVSMTGLPFVENEHYFKGENGTTYIPLSIEVSGKNVVFRKSGDRYKGIVNFYIEIKDKTGTVFQTSDLLEMNLKEETYQHRLTDYYQYIRSVSLVPGEYFLHTVLWDEYSKNVGYIDKIIQVPQLWGEGFNLSTIILARSIKVKEVNEEEVSMKANDIPIMKYLSQTDIKVPEKITFKKREEGPFTFGKLEINPNTLAEYAKNEELVFFYQIYNPTFDEIQKMAKLLIEYQIWMKDQLITTIDRPKEAQILGEKRPVGINGGARYSLADLKPGKYTLLVRVEDIFSEKTFEKKTDFVVK